MLHALLLLAAVAAAGADTTHLVLVATTDVHGHATDWDYLADAPFPGGLARAATVVDSLRARYPGRVLVVDAGDLIEGDPFASYFSRTAPRDPHPVIEALNLIGYDAATPGNHDFDYGVPTFERALASAAYRYVSANLHELPRDTLALPASAVVVRGGVRVAITGFTTPGVMVWDAKALRGRMRVTRIGEAAARYLPGIRREADVVVALVHSGIAATSSYDTAGVGPEDAGLALAAGPARPDLVVLGHSHREIVETVVNGVHFVQPAPFAQSLAVVHLELIRADPRGPWRLARIRAERVPLATVPPSRTLAARQAGAKAEVRAWLDASVGEARGALPGRLARAEATPLMNLVHAVQRARTGADLSAAAAFNLGAGLPDGDVRRRDVFALYPYENTLRAVRITGAQLKDYLEQSARYFTPDSAGRPAPDPRVPGYDYDMVGGASYEIDLRLPVGSRIRNLAVRGRPVAPADTYTLALNSHRQSGGGGYTALAGAPVVYDRDENIRDLLMDEIRRHGVTAAELAETNWRIVPREAAEAVRRFFGAPAPAAAPPVAAGERIEARLLAIGPLAGALRPQATAPGGGRVAGGAAALKSALDRSAAECACPAVRLATGGALSGSAEADAGRGRPAVEALNRLELSASALGPEDAGWSLDTLRQRVAESRFPWLAENVVDSASGRRPDWLGGVRIVEERGVRVAVVGYLDPAAQPALRAAGFGSARVDAGAAALRPALAQARAARPDLVVVLAHAAATCDAAPCAAPAVALADELQGDGVDVIVASGGDAGAVRRVGRVWVVQPRGAGAEVAVVDLVRTAVGERELRVRREPVDADALPPDSAVATVVARYAAAADSVDALPVARLKLPIERRDGALAALVADAERNALRADAALVDPAALAADLPAGTVTVGAVRAAFREPDPLVRVRLRGSDVRRLVAASLRDARATLAISGLMVRWSRGGPSGAAIRRITLVDGRAFRDATTYVLAMTRTLARSPALGLPASSAEPAGTRDFDAVVAYLRRLPQPVALTGGPRFEEVSR
ncbi:MAG TPA: 5'-nucleotidase C-terminal domain-containing protein [Gemmatimonadales bacterium]|nr:5'-nucleotidase C-terminal domain-containing protein [Gemmatimonadales bacterium]